MSLLLASASVLAATYVRVEKDGTKTYSDRPLPGGQQVDLQPAQTYTSQPAPPSTAGQTGEQRDLMAAANFQYQCALTPPNEQTFQNPESVTVTLSLSPQLRMGDDVLISLDGNQLSQGDNSTTVTISYPDRGTHTATARVTDQSGKTLCNTSSTFHVQRSNLNSPTRRPTPTPRPRPRG